jgi:molybdate-binding protein
VFTLDIKFEKKSTDEYDILVNKNEADIFQKIKVEKLDSGDFG